MNALALQRTLPVLAQLPPRRARTLLGMIISSSETSCPPIQCGARVPHKARLAAAHYARREPVIARMHEAIAEQLDKAKHETLARIKAKAKLIERLDALHAAEAGGVAADIIFDPRKFREGLLATLRDETLHALETAGSEVMQELGHLDPFSMPNPVAVDFIDSRANLLTDIPDEIHAQIETTIQDAMHAGKSIAQMARDIRQKFAEIEKGRAETIASTETGVAYSFARQQGFLQAGVQHKSWLTSGLDTVRDTHRDAEADERNQRVPVREPFHVGKVRLLAPGLPFTPRDDDPGEIINCHCIALALEEP